MKKKNSFQAVKSILNHMVDKSRISNLPKRPDKDNYIINLLKRIVNDAMTPEEEKIVYPILAFFCMVCIGMLILINVFEGIQGDQLNSDDAIEIILANEILTQKAIFPKGWYYTTEINILRPFMLAIPFLSITNNMLLSQSVAAIICVLVFCVSWVYLLHSINVSKIPTMISLIFLLTVPNIMDMMYIRAAYYFFIFFCIFMTIGYHNNCIKKNIRCREKCLRYILPLMAFMFGVTSIRMLLTLYIPLLLSYGVYIVVLLMHNANSNKVMKYINRLLEVLFWTVLNVAGIALYKKLFVSTEYIRDGYINTQFSKAIDIIDSFSALLVNGLEIVGYKGSVNVFSVEGIYNCIKIFLIIFTIVLIPRIHKCHQESYFSCILYFFMAIVILFFLFIFLQLDNNATRYFYPLILFVAIIIANYNHFLKPRRIYQYAIVLCAIIMSFISLRQGIPRIEASGMGNKNKKAVVEYIKEAESELGVSMGEVGYATYWNAAVLTVLSNNVFEIGNIQLDSDFSPYLWGTKEAYYSPELSNERTFLILTDEEEASIYEQYPDHNKLSMGEKVKEIDSYNIYVYDFNPFVVFGVPDVGE